VRHGDAACRTHGRIDRFSETFDVFQKKDSGAPEAHGCTVRVNANSAYGALPVKISKGGPRDGAGGLIPAGDAYTVWPENAPIDAEVEIAVPIAENMRNDSHVGLYRKLGNGWGRESAEKSGGRLVVKTRRFGIFQAMSDTTPPTVRIISPDPSKPARSRRPEIQAGISDTGSGIAGVNAACGDQWLLMEYDPERERVTWMRDEDLPAGKQTVHIAVSDSAGNSTTKNLQLNIPEKNVAQ